MTDRRTDRRTELRWLRRAIAVPAVARKNEATGYRCNQFVDSVDEKNEQCSSWLYALYSDILCNASAALSLKS